MLIPKDPAQEKFPLYSWWRQEPGGKEFVVIEYNYNTTPKYWAIIGLKILERYSGAYRVIDISRAKNLLEKGNWREITIKP